MIDRIEIPQGWEIVKLGEVCKLKNGYAFKKLDYTQDGIPVIRIGDINDGVVSATDSVKVIADKEYENYVISRNEILVAMSGATTGKFGIYKSDEIAYQNQRVGKFQILHKGILENKFLFFLLHFLKGKILKDAYGGAQPNISSGKIEELKIPLPPLKEQEIITSKLEELFSELDKGIEYLKTAQQQLKIYRQAVLKWAFEDAKKNRKEYLLKDVSEKIQIGPFGTQLHKEDYIEGGVPLINPMHIEDGKIVANSSYTITKQKRVSLPNYIMQVGDVIMGRRGEMGRCALVGEKENGWFCGTGSLYIRPNKKLVNSTFLFHYLVSDTTKRYLEENSGGTTMANLNLKIVNNIPIYLPSIKEQIKIIQEIESRLSICDKIEETISETLLQAEALRLSIIKKAFEGKLVKQNPKDEPATKLLERIRAEKKKNEPEEKVKTKNKKKEKAEICN